MDEFPELEEIYSVVLKPKTLGATSTRPSQPTPTGSAISPSSLQDQFLAPSSAWSPRSLYSGTKITSPSKRRRTNETSSENGWTSPDPNDHSSHYLSPSFLAKPASLEQSTFAHEDPIDSLLRAADFSEKVVNEEVVFTSPQSQVGTQTRVPYNTPRAWSHGNVQEACLMRYFIDELACWVHTFPVFSSSVYAHS